MHMFTDFHASGRSRGGASGFTRDAGFDRRAQPATGGERVSRTFPLEDLDLLVSIVGDGPTASGEPARMRLRSLDLVSEAAGTDCPAARPDTVRPTRAAEPGHPSRAAAQADPVIGRLTRALDWVEGNPTPHGSLYADAVRLAIAARMAAILSGDGRFGEPDTSVGYLPKWRLRRVQAFVEANLSERITLADLAAAAGLSRMHFAAQFRVATGMRPHEFVLRRRIARACDLLVEPGQALADIALAVGFHTQAHFTTVFRGFVGETPHRWRTSRWSERDNGDPLRRPGQAA